MANKSTNSNLIYSQSFNSYKDAYTKDIEKWKFMEQSQTKSYAYEPEMPNHIKGVIKPQ